MSGLLVWTKRGATVYEGIISYSPMAGPEDTPSIDVLEPEIERVLVRFRIPSEDAQELLDEVLLSLLTKRDRIRDPQRWLLRTLRNRCLLYWRVRRRRLHRVVDSGLLTMLTSPEVPEEEKEALREELRSLLPGIHAGCREILTRRYGLEESALRPDPRPWDAKDETAERVLHCLEALARRFARGQPPDELPPDLSDDPEEGFGGS